MDKKSTLALRLYLIRHGETEWSLTGQHTGLTDIALTERGKAEASELAQRLQTIPFSQVWSSPLQRALQTCERADLEPQPEIEPALAEWNYGDYEGQRSSEILEARPDWNLFRDGGPNGESPAQVSERADFLIARLQSLQGNVALFTHGHFGRVLAARWIGSPVSVGQHFKLGTASVSILGYDPHHLEVPVISLWNATAPVAFEPEPSPAVERWENEGGETPEEAQPIAARLNQAVRQD